MTSAFILKQSEPNRARQGMEARLALDFQQEVASGVTRLSASTQEPPLRVVRAFAREDGSSLAHLHNVSGGILGGDRLFLNAILGTRAQVLITTTGATRIYRPRTIAAPAEQHNKIEIAEDAILEYVPDQIIPYRDVRFSQHSEIRLAKGAGIFWWEILSPGREARGEVFEYECVNLSIDIFASGRLIAAERTRLEPKRRAISSLGRLAGFRYWVSFYICRVGVDSARWLAVENELRERARLLASPAEALWAISTLPAHGIAIRGLARSNHGILDALHSFWRAAKTALYGNEPMLPRKVN
jgi:urease accessory protein